MNHLSTQVADVDIVISTYARGTAIDATIASIRANTYRNFRLWVLDQSQNCITEQCVKRHVREDARIHYCRVPERGLCATRNMGSTLGTAPHILFTNDDIRVSPTWIAEMRAALMQYHAHAVFGRVLADQDADDHVTGNEVVLGLKDSATVQIFERNWFDLSFGHGHNMAVTRASFELLHGFDERLGAGGPLGAWDDRDYGYRVLIHQGRIVYTPRAIGYHRHWQDWVGVQRSYANYGRGVGAAVAKYLRCGRPETLLILAEWMASQGLRQTFSGALKVRNRAKMRIGLSQLYHPLLGFTRGLRYPVECTTMRYCGMG